MQTHTKESLKKVIGQNNLVYAFQNILNIMFVGDITAQTAFRSLFFFLQMLLGTLTQIHPL